MAAELEGGKAQAGHPLQTPLRRRRIHRRLRD